MEKMYIFIIGICLGFFVCILMMGAYQKRIVDRGYISVGDKLYDVKLKVKE